MRETFFNLTNLIFLRGRVKFPIGGKPVLTGKPASRKAGFGESPKPTV